MKWQGALDAPRVRNLVLFALIALAVVMAYANSVAAPEERLEGAALYITRIAIVLAYFLALIFTRLRVEVTDENTKVIFGWGWPVKKIRHEQIAAVDFINVRPLLWGGWGYRWVPWKRGSAAVLRAGEGLQFTYKSGKVFVVTVDDAQAAADALRQLVRG